MDQRPVVHLGWQAQAQVKALLGPGNPAGGSVRTRTASGCILAALLYIASGVLFILALRGLGATPAHRRSFAPVAQLEMAF